MEGVVNSFLVTFSLLALASMLASASDPSSLQDFCLTLNGTNHNVFVNGNFCKDPKLVTADDFFSGLDNAGNTSNAVGSRVTTTVNADQILGLDKLGISLVRIDYAPNGGLTPHTHPRATEVLVVTKGKLYVDFVTSNPDNHLFAKVRREEVFVFLVCLIHFQFNIGNTDAVAFAGLSSQNPGVATIGSSVWV
ncbi:Germin-like protein subfamily 1 member 13 [Hibiscus syriacus]|uniref:Germin-like protein n=1 Tax=Hibiscus syriacus TaxID=106335 RepID=A0A6A2WXJ1_HIBSY|nr:Germin-like protein subfamily 1 member 13 [Hibiscus syriacus]